MGKALVIDGKSYFKKILIFSLPLMLTGVLQSFYNAADLIVVGRFESDMALAAVGSTGSLTNLILGLFMGLSVGAGVTVAHAVGAGKRLDVQRTLHTAICIALILGAVVGAIGFVLAPQLLRLMDSPEEIIGMSALYVRIIFLGAPASIVYNYAAAMLRATGDSKHPLVFLAVSGLVNVICNLILVVPFGLGVIGVGVATILSQYVSAVMIIVHLSRQKGALRFSFKRLRIHKDKVGKILMIGIPSGVQGTLFSFSNVILQSSINSLGPAVVAGSAASSNIESFYYVAYHAFYDAALTFVGQCVGAKRYKDIKKIVLWSMLIVLIFAVVLITVGLLLRDVLIGMYITDNPAAFDIARARYAMLVIPYFLCGFMEIGSGTLRGMGRSVTSAVISLIFACLFRVIWIAVVFRLVPIPEMIYITYPISWILTTAVTMLFVTVSVKKEQREEKTRAMEYATVQLNSEEE